MAEVDPYHLDATLFNLFRKEFELCGVDSTYRCAVIYDSGTRPDYVKIAMSTLASLDAEVFSLYMPNIAHKNLDLTPDMRAAHNARLASTGEKAVETEGPDFSKVSTQYAANTHTNPTFGAIAQAVDFVVDLVRLQHSPGRVELLNAGVKYLSITERPDTLARTMPRFEDKAFVMAAAALMERSKTFHVTSKAGTDFTADIDGTRTLVEYGFADNPGMYSVWPGGIVATFPNPHKSEGVIIIDKGDLLSGFNRYATSQVRFEIEKGYITNISGDGMDADLIRETLEEWDDPECYATSHVGWGLSKQAKWHAIEFYNKDSTNMQDGRAFAGNFMWSTGPQPAAKRFVPGHFDFPMRSCTVWVDDTMVVDGGRLIEPFPS